MTTTMLEGMTHSDTKRDKQYFVRNFSNSNVIVINFWQKYSYSDGSTQYFCFPLMTLLAKNYHSAFEFVKALYSTNCLSIFADMV